jgi:hypothetical protein
VLLEQQNMAAGGIMGGASAFDLEPGTELSLQDLDRIDQGSPEKHAQAAAAAAGAAKVNKSPRRGTTATAAAGSGQQAVGGAVRRVDWSAGESFGGWRVTCHFGTPRLDHMGWRTRNPGVELHT